MIRHTLRNFKYAWPSRCLFHVYACRECLHMSTSLLNMIASELPLELHLQFCSSMTLAAYFKISSDNPKTFFNKIICSHCWCWITFEFLYIVISYQNWPNSFKSFIRKKILFQLYFASLTIKFAKGLGDEDQVFCFHG